MGAIRAILWRNRHPNSRALMSLILRNAALADIPELNALIARSARGLSTEDYRAGSTNSSYTTHSTFSVNHSFIGGDMGRQVSFFCPSTEQRCRPLGYQWPTSPLTNDFQVFAF